MARTTAELLAQLRRLVPGYYSAVEPLLAGFAAAMALAETALDELAEASTFEGADLSWLRLHARGYGIRPGSGEPEASLRSRLRRVEDQVTRPAILAAVDAIIAPDEATIIEWFEGPYLDVESSGGCWLDSSLISGGPNSFLVKIPQQSTGFAFGEALDSTLWMDSSFIGEAPEDPSYQAIINEVERMRAAGVFWRLVLET